MISRKQLGLSLILVLLAVFALMPWASGIETCPRGCQCLSEAGATQSFGAGNYQMCQSAPCGKEQSPTGAVISKYCFKSKCPTGCRCLTEEKAKDLGYTPCSGQMISCGRDEAGKTLYCFSPAVVCPPQCRCLTEEEAKEMGYDKLCQDERVPCSTDAYGKPKYCFKKPEQAQCQYDYALGKCVGQCVAGKKCQLNTIYHDPKTGAVTYAECHCK